MCSLLILIYFLLTVVHSYSCRFCHLLCRESDPLHPQQQIVRSLRTLRSQRYWQSPCLLWYWRYLRHYSYWYCPSWHYSVCGLRTTETTCLHVWNKIHKHWLSSLSRHGVELPYLSFKTLNACTVSTHSFSLCSIVVWSIIFLYKFNKKGCNKTLIIINQH